VPRGAGLAASTQAAELASATGLRRRDLTWSYLALNRHDARVATSPIWRVVSERLDPKGKHEAYLCGETGRGVPRCCAGIAPRTPSPSATSSAAASCGSTGARADRSGLRLGAGSIVTVEDPVAAGGEG